jgi:hypothetical protein
MRQPGLPNGDRPEKDKRSGREQDAYEQTLPGENTRQSEPMLLKML